MGVQARFTFKRRIGDGVLNAIVARFPHCRAVVSNVYFNRVTDAGIAALASGCPQLRELGVEEAGYVSIPALTAAIEQLERVESLYVPQGTDLSREDGTALLAMLASKPGLRKLKFNNARLGHHLATILTFTKLVELDLNGCKIRNSGAVALAALLSQNGVHSSDQGGVCLKVLGLAYNEIGPDGAVTIAKLLEDNSTVHSIE